MSAKLCGKASEKQVIAFAPLFCNDATAFYTPFCFSNKQIFPKFSAKSS